MQIIIPMSGFGERFKAAGYRIPKPLITINNKTIIQHVVELFDNNCEFIFICNEDHLETKEFNMQKTINSFNLKSKIVSISPHKLGPVHAVLMSEDHIDLEKQTIVNYCDFSCYWNFENFKRFVVKYDLDGSIPAYKNFHPHSIHNNYYAFLKTKDLEVLDVQEKKPFTDNPIDEFASSGTYYFKSGDLMLQYFNKMKDLKLTVNNEYYVSMSYKPMIMDQLKVYTYNLKHFMQWGTPEDLHEYKYWSDIFESLIEESEPPRHDGALMLPMAGKGSRFKAQGYHKIKPMIKVSGKPMFEQALNDLPLANLTRLVLRNDKELVEQVENKNTKDKKKYSIKILNDDTDGQASTALIGSKDINHESPITIGACDNGMIYKNKNFIELMNDSSTDAIVWSASGYPGSIKNPKMYGWIEYDKSTKLIKSISVKEQLKDPKEDLIVVGTFTFKKQKYLIDSVNRMKKRKALVNSEYYIDMAINDSIALNLKCRVFEIDKYICWGTPEDLNTFEYWQSCFHKWKSHRYSIYNDPNIQQDKLKELESQIYDK